MRWGMKRIIKFVIILAILFLITVVNAVPTTGVPSGVSNNQANITCTGVTGSVAWVTWGMNPDGQVWKTENFTATAGTANTRIWGSPLQSNSQYYGKCCDVSGCDLTAESFTTLAASIIVQTTFSHGWSNLTESHFNLMYLLPALMTGYTDVIPQTLLYGLMFAALTIGLWFANKSARLVSLLFLIVGSFLIFSDTGLEMGIPGGFQAIGLVLGAAALAGIFLSFIRRG
jgi:hypothetical protein